MQSMTISSSEIEADLIRDEGWRDQPYKDTRGHLTIGVGHNLDTEGLCKEAILAQLSHDLRTKALDPLDANLKWWRDQPAQVQRVLINMAFNLGVGSLLKFKRLLGALQARDYQAAANHLRDSHPYVDQVGKRAERLAKLLESV